MNGSAGPAEREQEREAAERREREAREHTAQLERQRAEREAAERREQRDHEERLARVEAERAERERREQREFELAREARERADAVRRREQRVRGGRPQPQAGEQRDQPNGAVHERGDGAGHERLPQPSPSLNQPPTRPSTAVAKLSEVEALEAIRTADESNTVRQLAERTGWSVGWISARMRELQGVA